MMQSMRKRAGFPQTLHVQEALLSSLGLSRKRDNVIEHEIGDSLCKTFLWRLICQNSHLTACKHTEATSPNHELPTVRTSDSFFNLHFSEKLKIYNKPSLLKYTLLSQIRMIYILIKPKKNTKMCQTIKLLKR